MTCNFLKSSFINIGDDFFCQSLPSSAFFCLLSFVPGLLLDSPSFDVEAPVFPEVPLYIDFSAPLP
jgi:hypothetical protein